MKEFNAVIKVSTPENKVKNGYARDLLDLKNLDNAISTLREDYEHNLHRLESARSVIKESLDSRKNASSLYDAIHTGSYSVYKFSNVSCDSILRKYLEEFVDMALLTLNGDAKVKAYPEDSDIRRTDVVIVDNAYGGDRAQYVQTVGKGMGINYHPTLFRISVGSKTSDEELSALVRIVQDLLDDDSMLFEFRNVSDGKRHGWSNLRLQVVRDDLYAFLKIGDGIDDPRVISESDFDRIDSIVDGDWISHEHGLTYVMQMSCDLVDADGNVISRGLIATR
jgi:hypothetical protein